MKVVEAAIPGVLILEPDVFLDARGRFTVLWSEERYRALGIHKPFVQDNVSVSRKRVIRGLHFQHPGAQAKLVSVLAGEIFDVAVDVRVGSATFGQSVSCALSSRDHRQVYVPEGFAHGFGVMSPEAAVLYKCTAPYRPSSELTLRWDNLSLGIDWPILDPIVSAKDQAGVPLAQLTRDHLPRWGAVMAER